MLKLDEEGTYCLCCQMPYVEDDQLYPICSSNEELGELGPGFPLFFQFIKYLCYLMLILTVIYFIPAANQMYNAYVQLHKAGLNLEQDNVFALFSFGAFIANSSNSSLGYEYYSYEDR